MTGETIVQAGLIVVLAFSAGVVLRKIQLPRDREHEKDDDQIHWL